MDEVNYNEIVALLEQWIRTWRDDAGRYNGPVVHRRDLKRLKYIHDTPWSQAEIINGYIHIYKKTNDKFFLNHAVSAANAQKENLRETGEFQYAGYEDDRFSSLVHNALADCALLNVAILLKEQGELLDLAEQFVNTTRINIEKYIIGRLYNPDIGAFKFNEIDYYSPDENRCVCNMNAIAAEAMVKLSFVCKDIDLKEYINGVGAWIKEFVSSEEGINHGAISYSHTQEKVYISIYTALALRGICSIYDYNQDQELLRCIRKAAQNLVAFMDRDMFMHESNHGRIYSKPWFISGSGMILEALRRANQYLEKPIDDKQYAIPFLKYQLPNGAFQNFVGYDSCGNRLFNKKERNRVWEDIFPTIGWNAQMFSYLSNYVDKEFKKIRNRRANCFITTRYVYYENLKIAVIVSWAPLRSIAFLVYKKGRDQASLSFSLLDFVRRLRGD